MVGFIEPSVMEEGDATSERCLGHSKLEKPRILQDMPRLIYVPIIKGPVALIKSRMLQEFDLLDCALSSLTAALNDFALRANRCGYRIVRANHARVMLRRRDEKDSVFAEQDAAILRARFPYLGEEITRYETGPEATALRLMQGLRPDAEGRLNVVFACNNLGNIHNGTSELASRIITEFSRNHSREYNIHLLCSRTAFAFHRYGELDGVHWSDPTGEQKTFFASIRLVQPFGDEDIALLANQAPVTLVLMLDTIAVDCMQIDPRLARVWERMVKSVSTIGFISDFSRAQFDRRFGCEAQYFGFTALCSTDTKEYGAEANAGLRRDGGYILLVGNPYEHKFLSVSCDLLRREAPATKLVVLGIKVPDDENISSFEGGQLNDEAVAELYARANIVFFPSHCEGFGLPIMHGLAHEKPVIARDLPVFREIQARIRGARNLHLFDTTIEMARFAMTRPIWNAQEVEPARPVQRWADMAKAIREALVEAAQGLSYRKLYDRLLAAEACKQIGKLEVLSTKQTRELAEMKLRWEPPIDEADIPGRAARFIAKRLENRMRPLLGWKWAYSLTRLGWRALKTFDSSGAS
ncbi:MAG: glycosyltransferase [Hyphomicrobiales bacterium]|nr:glycosyltransferase [Hyphomicrobiales bacterium]